MTLPIGIIKNISTADTATEIIAQASQEGKRAIAVQTDSGWCIRIAKPQNQVVKLLGVLTGQNAREQTRLNNLISSLPSIASLRERSAQIVAQKYVAEFKSSEPNVSSGEALSEAISKAWPSDPKPVIPTLIPPNKINSPFDHLKKDSNTNDIELNEISRPAFNQWIAKSIKSTQLEELWAIVPELAKKNYVRASLLGRSVVREYAFQQLGINQQINNLSDYARNQWADKIADRVVAIQINGSHIPYRILQQQINEKVTLADSNGFSIHDM